jgi:alkylation response protein AidB-like acyl-CoA dehydrogenase
VFDAGADSTVAYLPPGAQLVALVHPDRVSVRRIAELDSVSALQGLDPGQGASLVRDDGGPPGDLELDGRAAADLRRRWAVAGMCEAFGAAQRCLEMACEYASEREQFGVKIVSFQAVSHRLARMAVGLEAAEAGIGRLVAPQGDDGRLLTALSHAVPAAARCACEGAIQVFGGAGFSWELGLHLYYRRVLAIQHELGGDGASLRRAGAGYLASIRERDDG